MKKIIFLTLLGLIGAGAYFGWRMMKGDGGWGGDNVDPWTSYTPPAEDTAAGASTDTDA